MIYFHNFEVFRFAIFLNTFFIDIVGPLIG